MCENEVISKMEDSGGTELRTDVRGIDNRGATEGKNINYGVNFETDKDSSDYKVEHKILVETRQENKEQLR